MTPKLTPAMSTSATTVPAGTASSCARAASLATSAAGSIENNETPAKTSPGVVMARCYCPAHPAPAAAASGRRTTTRSRAQQDVRISSVGDRGVLLGECGEVGDLGRCPGEFAGPPVRLRGGGMASESGERVAAGCVPMVLPDQAGFTGEGLEVVEAGLRAFVPG